LDATLVGDIPSYPSYNYNAAMISSLYLIVVSALASNYINSLELFSSFTLAAFLMDFAR